MDSNEIDPTWGTRSSDTPPDDIDPGWPPPSVEPPEAGLSSRRHLMMSSKADRGPILP